jgi:hypothetical protein
MTRCGLRAARRGGVVLAVASAAMLGAACGVPGRHGHSGPENVVVVLFDESSSTRSATVRRRYMNGYNQVLELFTNGAGGVVAGDVIDDNSLMHSSYPILATIKKGSIFSENKLVRRTKIKKQALKPAERLLSVTPRHGGTAILDALTVAERFFGTYPDAKHRYLVVFSDMVEESDHLRFNTEVLSYAGTSRFIANERRDRRLPNLAGIDVYVVGAGSPVNSNMKAETIRKIENFWLKYFAATGAVLPPARYGSRLIKFP